jgi:ATP-dependent DNA helicase DinG
MSQLLEHFPQGYNPTDVQEEILIDVERALNSNAKFVILNAPTGSGKSFISKTLANTSSRPSSTYEKLVLSYDIYKMNGYGYVYQNEIDREPVFGSAVLTITKALQDQYLNTFKDTAVLKGKGNYQCQVDMTKDAEIAPCRISPNVKQKCFDQNICPYYKARNEAIISRFACLNYNAYLRMLPVFRRKQLLICDEASELEEEIIKIYSATLTYLTLDKMNIKYTKLASDTQAAIFNWLSILQQTISNECDVISARLKKNEEDSEQNRLKTLLNIKESLVMVMDHWHTVPYLVEKDAEKVSFCPIHAHNLTKELFDYGEKILLMSATIIDHKQFAASLGINENDYVYIEARNTFPPEKAPIHVCPKYKLNRNTLETALPGICEMIEFILDSHKNEKGVIHTHTHAITQYIQKYFKKRKNKRMLYREQGVDNETILLEHKLSSAPSVLVSPSLTFGVDLPDDLARFQVIVKLPYPSLADKRVAHLLKIDPNWYKNKMFTHLVQACGRGIRHKDDSCTTYILDATIIRELQESQKKLPKYFIDRFV